MSLPVENPVDDKAQMRMGGLLLLAILLAVTCIGGGLVFLQRKQAWEKIPAEVRAGAKVDLVLGKNAPATPLYAIAGFHFDEAPQALFKRLQSALAKGGWKTQTPKNLGPDRFVLARDSLASPGVPLPDQYIIVGPGEWTAESNFLKSTKPTGTGSMAIYSKWEPAILPYYLGQSDVYFVTGGTPPARTAVVSPAKSKAKTKP